MIDMGEDEPEQLEFGRLSELQRRNTLYLPHLRSAYPVETQVRSAYPVETQVRSAYPVETQVRQA